MEAKKYNWIIVGAGLFGAVCAYRLKQRGERVLVLERRPHIGGNTYCEEKEGIILHKYGPHIFHTSDEKVWNFVNSFVEFNRYTNAPMANYQERLYNLPFNMNTFYQMWGVKTPAEAKAKIEEQREEAKQKMIREGKKEPSNLEEQALLLIGSDIYEKLIKGYTQKQWGRKCTDLPAFIIRRLPVRFTFNNNYFNDKYQGIPIGGYNQLINKLLEGVDVKTGIDYINERNYWDSLTNKIIFTGQIDEFYNYQFGKLEYRTLRFEEETIDCENYQGNAIINYTEAKVPYTRIIEHKHFEFGTQPRTVITKEYPSEWKDGDEPFYPINDERNNKRFLQYKEVANKEKSVLFGGRLAEYKYYDMDQVINSALEMSLE